MELTWAPPYHVSDTVRDIKDPEHPYSLEQLSVLTQESVSIDEKLGRIQYVFCAHILALRSFPYDVLEISLQNELLKNLVIWVLW
jgi:hypothetical protein